MSSHRAPNLHRPPPQDSPEVSDSESDDGSIPRTSTDIRRHDQAILEGEEEVERLLTGEQDKISTFKKVFTRQDGAGNEVKISDRGRRGYEREAKREKKREGRRARRRRGGGGQEEESELMYEMEEGHKDSSSASSSGNSSEVDRMNLGEMRVPRATSRKMRTGRMTVVVLCIVLAFGSVLFGAYRASGGEKEEKNGLKMLSNGTSVFAPTTIYISLDGFRADFLHRNITPHLNAFIKEGVSPKYMLPSFPSVTFPNHFTLMTGLYPESHGIVGNTFWDPDLEAEFYYTDPDRSMQSKWWQAEPLWVTAEHQGIRTAIHMWPGSEAHIGDVEPTYVDKYNGQEPLSNKVDRILGLLDLPGPNDPDATDTTPRPQLIAAYVPNVDAHGHLYGPNSTEINADISAVDTMLGALFAGLATRNLTSIVNIVVVSDHGMASTSTTRLIQLESLLDTSLISHTDGWPLYGLRPSDPTPSALSALHASILATRTQHPTPHFDVFLRDVDMPSRYHFSSNPRIAPLWLIPHPGWAIVPYTEFNVSAALATDQIYHPRGLHGYDHEDPLMRAIFVARGPAFPHRAGTEVEVFGNVEVYGIVCGSLGVVGLKGNGSTTGLRVLGVHEGEGGPGVVPEDPPVAFEDTEKMGTEEEPEKDQDQNQDQEDQEDQEEQKDQKEQEEQETPQPTRPTINDGGDSDSSTYFNHWFEWVKGKLDGAKDWAVGVYHEVSAPGSSTSGDSTPGDSTPGR